MNDTDPVSGETGDIALTPKILITWKESDQKWLTDGGLKTFQ